MSTCTIVPPQEALDRLLEGHQRFIDETMDHASGCRSGRRQVIADGQDPFAVILSCADSRVSPEHIFDAGLGEIFVCRNAGNLLDELTVGSLEYAVMHCACRLVCIMGHTGCGAAHAAIEWSRNPEMTSSHNVDDIMLRLKPAIDVCLPDPGNDDAWAVTIAEKNVELMCQQLFERSPMLTELGLDGSFKVVGVFYDLVSGRMEIINPLMGPA